MHGIGEEEITAVTRVIRSGQLFRYDVPIGNPKHLHETEQFEKEFASRMQTDFCLSVSNGTAALICALGALGIGPGDEVIVPAYTFVATPIAVLKVGAIPVIAEVDDTLTLDPEDLKEKITPRTKAVIAVHEVFGSGLFHETFQPRREKNLSIRCQM